jgi:Flp pilus assembly protein TadB
MSQDTPEKKGRPTPKRKDAEAKRVVNSLAPATNRAERQQQKALSRQSRGANRAAYMRGEEGALPARDRGPVRKFVRNYVDSRRSVAEYLLPLLFVVLIVSRLAKLQVIAVALMYLVFVGAMVEGFILTRRIKREIAIRFPDAPTKGLGLYGWSRSTQLRRLRAPSPQVKAGDKLP